jgi:hypothetical protein
MLIAQRRATLVANKSYLNVRSERSPPAFDSLSKSTRNFKQTEICNRNRSLKLFSEGKKSAMMEGF